ncbi:MAG: hypothetical protein GXO78_13200 [Calditrichaeota bacterium]|nr:hypothetical protein [Calditrichota bacterium]
MLSVDRKLLQEFENQLNPANPFASKIPFKILGYGEISTVFQIGDMEDVALKRMPPFASKEQRREYRQVLEEYHQILSQKIGIRVAEYACEEFTNKDGEHILYIVQERLPEESIGHRWLQRCSDTELTVLIHRVLDNLVKIWRKNQQDAPEEVIGLDAQISNWSFTGLDSEDASEPVYLDTSTPLIRRFGHELLNTEIFLKSVPPFLVWIVKLAFLQQVLDRYYDLHLVLTDFVANFYKEGQAHRIPLAVQIINAYLAQQAVDLNIAPLSEKEVRKYYREDAFIWIIFLNFRRFDRFLKTRLFRRKYNFILPGTIKRFS